MMKQKRKFITCISTILLILQSPMAGRQYAHPFDTSIKEFVRHLSNLSFHHNINYISIILCIRKCVQDMGETNVSVIFVHHPHRKSLH